jgi:hypothetical protein
MTAVRRGSHLLHSEAALFGSFSDAALPGVLPAYAVAAPVGGGQARSAGDGRGSADRYEDP